ncbi:hypothetical protein F7725_005458 [Dissostichus mawsoni]|uniref:Uncharacterized protein n=1 Tax=Dissostichus mawsoni TaxID=36200 RepID=A0A7J5YSH8_DISMA|nr:hypothetical protein F7725_005458 [Dissostichus mawsoni]
MEEDAEAVPQPGVVLGDGIVPEQDQTGEHLGTGYTAGVHEFGETLCRLCTQVDITPWISPHCPGTLRASRGYSEPCPLERLPSPPPPGRPLPAGLGIWSLGPSDWQLSQRAAGSQTAAAGRRSPAER